MFNRTLREYSFCILVERGIALPTTWQGMCYHRYCHSLDHVSSFVPSTKTSPWQVPTNKAEATFTFLKAWIENEEYPRYDKDCIIPPLSNLHDDTRVGIDAGHGVVSVG